MSKKNYYITTPLYYVNAKPHIGHAYTNILCDMFARYHKLKGEKVFFLTGTDEHGTKIEKSAKEAGLSPLDFVEKIVPEFRSLWKKLDIQYNDFIRTTEDRHKKVVSNILKKLEEQGDIYKASYKGWYCTPCESFWTNLQLVEGNCPDCGREVQELSEENYFFKLAKYQDWLIKYINENQDFIKPEMRKNEILGFLREPLEDLCITRPRTRLEWGIDYPNSNEHVIYVWFDALINYISAIGFTEDDAKFESHWPADLQVVGKDILRHHAAYWPIMLHACGLPLPKTLLAHGWWTMAGAKVSKSRGNAVDPVELVEKYGVDAFRYFLEREVTIGQDGAFSEDLLAERYKTDLANDLGNLWFRFASMLGKYFEGKVPEVDQNALASEVQSYKILFETVDCQMLELNPRKALDAIWELIVKSNQFVEEKKPWKLAKDPESASELAETMRILAERLAHLAYLLRPFLPNTAESMLARLTLPVDAKFDASSQFCEPLLEVEQVIERGEVLFAKLEDLDETEKENAKAK